MTFQDTAAMSWETQTHETHTFWKQAIFRFRLGGVGSNCLEEVATLEK